MECRSHDSWSDTTPLISRSPSSLSSPGEVAILLFPFLTKIKKTTNASNVEGNVKATQSQMRLVFSIHFCCVKKGMDRTAWFSWSDALMGRCRHVSETYRVRCAWEEEHGHNCNLGRTGQLQNSDHRARRANSLHRYAVLPHFHRDLLRLLGHPPRQPGFGASGLEDLTHRMAVRDHQAVVQHLHIVVQLCRSHEHIWSWRSGDFRMNLPVRALFESSSPVHPQTPAAP